MWAAERMAGGREPSGRGGVASTTSGTPATRAGITVMSTVDGDDARPPGAYTPARRTGRVTSSRPVGPLLAAWTCLEWTARMRWAAHPRAAPAALGLRFAAAARGTRG